MRLRNRKQTVKGLEQMKPESVKEEIRIIFDIFNIISMPDEITLDGSYKKDYSTAQKLTKAVIITLKNNLQLTPKITNTRRLIQKSFSIVYVIEHNFNTPQSEGEQALFQQMYIILTKNLRA